MTPPVLNNDKRLFKLGGVIHLVDPIGIEPTTLRMRTVRSPECDTTRAPFFWQDEAFCWLCLGLCIARDGILSMNLPTGWILRTAP